MSTSGSASRRGVGRAVQRWGSAAPLVLAAVVVAASGWRDPWSMAISVVLLVGAACLSPFAFPRSASDAVARERASEEGVPLVYWRPGCAYCLRLRLSLGVRGNAAVWVDIWSDADAAARVRAHNGGDETVPTVVVEDLVRTNPPAAWVRERLRGD